MNSLEEIGINPVAASAAIGVVEGLGFVALTTIYNHRQLTHESLLARAVIRTAGRVANFFTGIKGETWAKVHIKHHSYADANLVSFIETADYLDWRETQPDEALEEHAPIPETFNGLDPRARLTKEKVQYIGGLARKEVEGRYEVPRSYTAEESSMLLDADTPRYFYAKRPGIFKRLIDKTAETEPPVLAVNESLHKLTPELRDPHSPLLHRQGVLGILRPSGNIPLYRAVAKYFDRLEAEEKALGVDNSTEKKKLLERSEIGIPAFFAGNIAVQAVLEAGISPEAALQAAVLGSFAVLVAYGLYLTGGNVTNAFGHAGKSIWKGLIGKLQMKADGTFTSNAKSMSAGTFDEVGGQEPHHSFPWLVAYSVDRGWRRARDATFGSFLRTLIKHNILLDPGRQFGHPELNDLEPSDEAIAQVVPLHRPDMPTEAVLELQKERAQTALAHTALESIAA